MRVYMLRDIHASLGIRAIAIVLACMHLVYTPAVHAGLPISVQFEGGFNDGTKGAQRRQAFNKALDIWSKTLQGDIPVAVRAVFENLNDPGPLGKGWHDESGRNQRCERRSCARKPN